MLEGKLADENRVNFELRGELDILREKCLRLQLQVKQKDESEGKEQKLQGIFQEKLLEMEEQLTAKEIQLIQNKETIGDIQMKHIERTTELENKIKKAASDQKDLTEKLRKANLELRN